MFENKLNDLSAYLLATLDTRQVQFDDSKDRLTLDGGRGRCPIVMNERDGKIELAIGRNPFVVSLPPSEDGWRKVEHIVHSAINGSAKLWTKTRAFRKPLDVFEFNGIVVDPASSTIVSGPVGQHSLVAEYGPYQQSDGTDCEGPTNNEFRLRSIIDILRSRLLEGVVIRDFGYLRVDVAGPPGCCRLRLKLENNQIHYASGSAVDRWRTLDCTDEGWSALGSIVQSVINGTVTLNRTVDQSSEHQAIAFLFNGRVFAQDGNATFGADAGFTELLTDYLPYSQRDDRRDMRGKNDG